MKRAFVSTFIEYPGSGTGWANFVADIDGSIASDADIKFLINDIKKSHPSFEDARITVIAIATLPEDNVTRSWLVTYTVMINGLTHYASRIMQLSSLRNLDEVYAELRASGLVNPIVINLSPLS